MLNLEDLVEMLNAQAEVFVESHQATEEKSQPEKPDVKPSMQTSSKEEVLQGTDIDAPNEDVSLIPDLSNIDEVKRAFVASEIFQRKY